MGTNFFIKIPEGKPCDKCGRFDVEETIHIGKSSVGWRFLFTPVHNCFDDWRKTILAHDGHIYDEYDRPISAQALLDYICAKQESPLPYDDPEMWFHKEPLHCEYLDPLGFWISKTERFS